MLLNPVERYMEKKGMEKGMERGKLETAWKMLDDGFSMDKVVELTGLSKKDILNAK